METRGVKQYVMLGIGALFVLGAFGYLGYKHYQLAEQYVAVQGELASSTERVAELEGIILLLNNEKVDLGRTLTTEQAKNETFEKQIKEIADTVGVLDKLSKTDAELLQKYSKTYFLNEHYIPSGLSEIDLKYLHENGKKVQLVHSKVLPYLENLMDAARKDGLDLRVLSAYRTFGEQSTLKSTYTVLYGAGTANQFSAEQGFSEHQLGTTVDFTNSEVGGAYSGFSQTDEYTWLLNNAHRFGFILSYPRNNGFYEFEPWHWRFVGVELARTLDTDGAHFYDLNQREIDTYLVNIFN